MGQALESYPPLGPHWQGLEVLSRGANRLCARAPDQPGYCLKFELAPAERTPAGARERLRRVLARRFPRWGENATELRAYQQLYARWGAGCDALFARCDAIVDTAWGRALRCELMRTGDGLPARSLYAHMFDHSPYSADALCAEVDRIERWLLDHRVPLFDLNPGNFVVTATGVRPQLVCVDAKSILSNKEPLPLSRWSAFLMQRKIRRRAARLRQRIRHALSKPADTL